MTVRMTIAAARDVTDGTLLPPGPAPGAPGTEQDPAPGVELGSAFEGVSIDSRKVEPGQAFVAIAGDRFDGHTFLAQAVERGATLLVVQRPPGELPPGAAVLRVPDTRIALGRLAESWRREVDPATVAITGSVGKTTTKELTCVLLAELGQTHCTPGNFNNDIGLPLTLLAMPRATRYLVAEMGMNAPGEIEYLTPLTRPDVGVVTCVAPVHLQGLGTLEAVGRAKGELLRGLSPRAWAVVPGAERLLDSSLANVAPDRRVRFGVDRTDEVRIVETLSQGSRGLQVHLALGGSEVTFQLPLVGVHNARNAAAAAAAALCLGLEVGRIGQALGGMDPARLVHRSNIRRIGPWYVLDDCYNANPLATRAALDTLVQLAGDAPGVAVLGEMLELGAEAGRYHTEVGAHAAGVGLQLLVAVGPLGQAIADGALEQGMPAEGVVHVDRPEEAADLLWDRARCPGTWVLVKGSRGARLERVIDLLSAGRP